MIIYGKEIRERIKEKIRQEAKTLSMSLAVVRVGEDKSSQSYLNGITKFGEDTGVKVQIISLPESSTEEEVKAVIEDLNRDSQVTGIMVQTPLPAHMSTARLINTIDYHKDVEGMHNYNLGKLISKQEGVKPATPKAVITMLEANGIDISGKEVTIVGRSMIVGSPLSVMMTAKNGTVTVCHTRTADLNAAARRADILVAAVGRQDFITADMVKEDCVIIDVGINVDEAGKIHGDVSEEARSKVKMASAVPGGVGTIVVAELFDNLRTLAHKQN